MSVITSVLDFFFPKRCIVCRKTGQYFCADCRQKLPLPQSQICPICHNPSLKGETHRACHRRLLLDGILFGFVYQDPIKKAVKKIKYRGQYDLVTELTVLALSQADPKQFKDFVLVPVPLHSQREKDRGFNQAEKIANVIGKIWQLPMETKLIKRAIATVPQFELSREQRLQNIRGAFELQKGIEVKEKQFLIVDDVFTTGATLMECTKLLKRAGARSVWAMTIAHGQ